MLFFSKTTNSFYDDQINSDIPECAVEITSELHLHLLDGQSKGFCIVADDKGCPVLQEVKRQVDPVNDILAELEQVDNMVSARTVREALTGDPVALEIIKSAEKRAEELRKKLKELNKDG